MQITDRAFLLDISPSPANVKVINDGPNIVYYKTSADVSSTSFDAALTAGAEVTFTSSQWLSCATGQRTNVSVVRLPTESADDGAPEGVTTVFTPWEGSVEVVQYEPRSAPDGTLILSLADRTTRASYDATEETSWEIAGIDVSSLTGTDSTLSDRLDALEDLDVVPSSELGVANGVAELDGTGKLKAAQAPAGSGARVVRDLFFRGEAAIEVFTPRLYFPTSYEQLSIELVAGVAPDGQSIIADVKKGTDEGSATTIFPVAAKPEIAEGEHHSGATVPDTTTGSAGDYLELSLTQVGVQPVGSAEFVDVSTITATASTIDIPRSVSAAEDDVYDLYVRISSATATVTTPAGWTLMGGVLTGGSSRWYRYAKKLGSSGADAGPWTITASTSVTWAVLRACVRGTHATLWDDGHVSTLQSSSTTGWTFADVTAGNANALELLYGSFNTTTTAPLPGTYTNRTGFGTGSAVSRALASVKHTTSGVKVGPSITLGSASTGYRARALFRPEDAPVEWTPGEDIAFIVRYVETS